MLNHFETSSVQDEIGAIGIDLTVYEIATSLIPVLIGMAVIGMMVVLALL